MDEIVAHIGEMGHSGLPNSIAPGLTSWLIGGSSTAGKVRMFDASREQEQFVTPHSHRFDLACCVIQGSVHNTIYKAREIDYKRPTDESYTATEITYLGSPGAYRRGHTYDSFYSKATTVYRTTQWYYMQADEIHSIVFEKGSKVLIFEGPQLTEISVVLEPS